MKFEINARHAMISAGIFAFMMWGLIEIAVFKHPLLIIPVVLGMGLSALFIGGVIDDVFLGKDND